MTTATTKAPRGKPYLITGIGIAILAFLVGAALYLTSAGFNDWVRARVIERLEIATGGRVEVAAMHWSLPKLELEAQDLTIHGLEPAGEAPYLHIDRIYLRARVVSLLQRDLRLRLLELDRPRAHLIAYPDGRTNQPTPRLPKTGNSIQSIFDLAANRLEVNNGVLVVNDHSTPLDFAASDFALGMVYNAPARRYDGTVHVGKADAAITDLRPFSFIADAKFSLFPDRVQLTSLTLRSGESRLDATGTLQDFAKPTVSATFNAKVEARLVAGIDRLPPMRAGVFDATGEVHYAASKFGASGKIKLGGLEWISDAARIHSMAVAADFTLDKDRILFPHLVAKALGGTISGSGDVTNWTVQQHGTLNLQASHIDLAAIANAGSTPSLPLNRLNLAGTTGGMVKVTWIGPSSTAVADLALQTAPPPSLAPNQLPVTAQLRGVYRDHTSTIDIASLDLSTPASHVVAAGSLGSRTADLKLTASTSNLGEISALIAARAPEGLPLEVRGQASFAGTIRGRLLSPDLAGRLQLANFDSVIPAPVPAPAPGEHNRHLRRSSNNSAPPVQPAPARRIHWDFFAGDLQYSPSSFVVQRGLLRRGTAQVSFDFSAKLDHGQFTRQSPIELQSTVRNAQFADVQALAGLHYPIDGELNLEAHVRGTLQDSTGSGSVQLTKAIVYGQPVARMTSDIAFAGQEARLTNIDVAQNHARVLGSAAYDWSSGSFRFDLRGNDFNLANLKVIQRPRLSVAGQMAFVARGSGSVRAPSIDADLSLRSLVVNGEQVGNIVAQARTAGEMMAITAHSNVENSDFRLDGTVRMRDDFPADIRAKFTHLDIDPFLRVYLKGRLSGHSSFAGTIGIHGPLQRPRDLNVVGDITSFFIPVESVSIRNQGPIRFGLAKGMLELKELHLIAEDTDFSASGLVQLGGQGDLKLRADGRLNLKLIQSLDPNFTSYGVLTLNTQVGGTFASPLVDGQVRVANAGISYIELPNALSDINGLLVFNRDRLQIQNLTARMGGGTFELAGYVTYARTMGFNIQGTAHDVRLRYPPGVSAMADANLRLSGTLQNSLLSGDITVTRFGLNPQFDFASYVARSNQPAELTSPTSPLNSVRLDVHVTSTPGLQVQTSLARLSGNVDLRIRGTVARPSVLGRVAIIEGDIFFNGTKYRLERGDVTFTNPTRIQPYLDIQASTRVRDYDITLGFHGPIDKLSTSYRSDPPLATADIIALLAFGRTREESAMRTVSNQNFTETASNAILGQALNATVSSRVQRLFGVSRLKIDPEVGGAENNPSSARVTIEQQVANNLTITYITDLARSNQQTISVEYNITRAVSIVAVRDQNGIVSFDVRIRQRKR